MNVAATRPTAAARPEAAAAAPAGVAFVDEAEGLAAIRDASCAGAVWARRAPDGFSDWIDGLDPDLLPSARGKVSAARAGEAAASLCAKAGTPEGPHRDWLVADIQRLACAFAAAMGVRRIRLRLDVVSGDACRKWHVDALTARLICTYRGSGTQLGTSPDVEARAEPSEIHSVPAAAPLVLRGTLWPETPPSGLLHRSPPIEGTGETRLLLVLDPLNAEDA
ncbi:MAG: DUF1826 domain-containing protein [Pseudomonadota bacterium]